MKMQRTKTKKCVKGEGILVTLVACCSLLGLVFGTNGVTGAVSYTSNLNVGFTFNSVIRINLSSASLVIGELTPGTYSDSNVISVGAGTNAAYGYQLTATVGEKNGTDALVNTLDNTKTFANLTASKASLDVFDDNTWGYSYCADTAVNCGDGGSATWVSGDIEDTTSGYAGLPLDDNTNSEERGLGGVTLISTGAAADNTQLVQFKIGARAGAAQAAGEYTNTINFYAVANPEPEPEPEPAPGYCTDTATCMQTMTISDCPTTPINVTDSRDGQTYKVAKLADDKCWMVENLNLAGGTALSADDTDVTSSYISSFSTSNNLTKTGDTIVLPASSTSGFNTANYSYVYNSGNKTNCGASGQNTPCYSYYSWDAATLGSGRTIAAENTDAPQSICPKGWRLPKSGADSNEGWKRGDFYALAAAYGANLESSYDDSSSATGANFYNNAGPGTIPGFLLVGYYYYDSFSGGGSYGYYWSSTSGSYASDARYLYFGSNYVNSANSVDRNRGYSVRCLFSGQ